MRLLFGLFFIAFFAAAAVCGLVTEDAGAHGCDIGPRVAAFQQFIGLGDWHSVVGRFNRL